jgi:predicted amidohydrolase
VTIVLAQHRRRADAAQTVEAVLGDLERHVTSDASFVVLPENAFVGADGSSPTIDAAAQCLERLSALANRHRTFVLTGSWLEPGPTGLTQTTRLLDPHGAVQLQVSRELEADGTTSTGADFPVVETEFGRVGILLGPDFWLLEPPRIQCLEGAELLIVAGSLAGRSIDAQRASIWGIATLQVVAVAIASGIGGGSHGGSTVAMPEGALLELADREGIFEAPLDLDRIRHLRQPDLRFQEKFWFGLWGRRPELYSPITERAEHLASVAGGEQGSTA